MKKNIVNKYGMYYAYFFSPMFGLAISSLTNVINGSKNPAIPFGAFGFFLYDLASAKNNKNIIIADINIENTFFVIEKFNGLASNSNAPFFLSKTQELK